MSIKLFKYMNGNRIRIPKSWALLVIFIVSVISAGAWIYTTPPDEILDSNGFRFGNISINSTHIITDIIQTSSIAVNNDITGKSLRITANTTGWAVNISTSGTGSPFIAMTNGTGGSASAGKFLVTGNGTDTALHVQRQDATNNPIATQAILKIQRDNSNNNDSGVMLYINDTNTNTSANSHGILIERQSAGNGYGIIATGKLLYGGTVTKSGGQGLVITRNVAEAGTRFLSVLQESNSANTWGVLNVINNGQGAGIQINQTGNGIPLIINNTGTSGDIQLDVHTRPITTGLEGQIAYNYTTHQFMGRNDTGWFNISLTGIKQG